MHGRAQRVLGCLLPLAIGAQFHIQQLRGLQHRVHLLEGSRDGLVQEPGDVLGAGAGVFAQALPVPVQREARQPEDNSGHHEQKRHAGKAADPIGRQVGKGPGHGLNARGQVAARVRRVPACKG